jgi:hypothetical protein
MLGPGRGAEPLLYLMLSASCMGLVSTMYVRLIEKQVASAGK